MLSGHHAVFTTIHEERVFPEVGQLVMGTHGILSGYGMGGSASYEKATVAPGVKLLGMRDVGTTLSLNQ